MAVRNIREIGDEILLKKAKEVTKINERTEELIDDMIETMYEANGVGLAAPQVGVLKRIVVIDTSTDEEEDGLLVLINPVITDTEGEQRGSEGCLSVPGKTGIVTRPEKVTVKFFDRDMNEQTLEAEGLLARAVCHECDHLEGKLYVELVEGELMDVNSLKKDEDEEENGEEA
ncbi:MAG: peptide deformylase [Lachnospiraceae bacterium]|nr:peptide deformylase [Lachnospiraceae bacterium]